MANIYKSNKTMELLGQQIIYPLIVPTGIANYDFENILKAHNMSRTNKYFNLAIDIFCLGFLYGKRAERAAKKGIELEAFTKQEG